ncbi:hypothetical protein CXB51_019021 [Gossypium anomalum]|uniref:L-dopachrome isomerase n=9 Tax=Gossypium TaxID=3633 RepID=A0A8J6CZG1_9ROSI|nr:hypothetical protein CXB51_019021 [Gossypium anomalum]
MPTLNLYTNVPVDAVTTSDILKDATKAVVKIIGKPESYVMILVNGGVPMAFAGTEAPAAYGELISIGGLGPSVNAKLSSTVADILQTKLSIDSSRFYIKFYDVQVFFFHSTFTIFIPCGHSLDSMVRLFDEWLKKHPGSKSESYMCWNDLFLSIEDFSLSLSLSLPLSLSRLSSLKKLFNFLSNSSNVELPLWKALQVESGAF